MNTIPVEIWPDLVDQFKNELTPEIYNTWFKPINIVNSTENSITVEVPNQLYQDWFNKNYLKRIKDTLEQTYKKTISISVLISNKNIPVAPPQTQTIEQDSFPSLKQINLQRDASLIPRYSFENFIVGQSNRFAHAASIAVAQAPAKAYNPLFLYGGVGLGKTHLMQAIAHYILNQNPSAKIFYVSCESFTNELINAIQNRTTLKFRSKFRGVDVLLIDDIHFLSGKEHAQEEFFHTFNTLYDAHKQIILSSDRPPKEIANLEERLISRFEWGLVTDLQAPDFETRVAILRRKAELSSVQVPDDIILYIAEKIKTNIRKLEGALLRVVSTTTLTGSELSVSMAEQVLQDFIISEEPTIVNIDAIQRTVAEYFDIRVADMKSTRRPKSIAFPRQIAMYLTRTLTKFSLPEIGEAFGGRDHSTVLHACKLVEQKFNSDFSIKKIIISIQNKLKTSS
jgi:chromosomal replication initiator protein